MKNVAVSLLFFLVFSFIELIAAAVPEGTGIMYDSNYSFSLTAPKGWVLDNSLVGGGVCAVFYPTESNWKDSPVVFYVNTKLVTDKMKSAQDAARFDMDDLHKKGSPNSKAEKVKELKLKDGRVASVWQYTGDRWGNYEQSAFVVEAKGISAMVLTARTKNGMDDAIPAFEQLIMSYEYMGDVQIKK